MPRLRPVLPLPLSRRQGGPPWLAARHLPHPVAPSPGPHVRSPGYSPLHNPRTPPPFSPQFLDVGSGCGVLTACGAYLVGRGGMAVGFDVRRACVAMGRENVRRLAATCPE